MSDARTPVMTGGCQCGAVRYALYVQPDNPHICHCRMCQKAFGGYFAPLAGVPRDKLAWTRGEPGIFMSSSAVERGFCRRCGTPLYYRYTGRDRISISLGSLDHPEAVVPVHQFGIEGRVPFFDRLHTLAGTRTEDDNPPDALPQLRTRQHPDHDTPDWPPREGPAA